MEKSLKIIENLLNIQEIIDIVKQANSMTGSCVEIIRNKRDFATKDLYVVFLNIMSKITERKTNKRYPNSVFYMVADSIYMKQHIETNEFCIRYDDFWKIYETEFKLGNNEIRCLLRDLLDGHIGCHVTLTYASLNNFSQRLEEQLKNDIN